jgi:hypothetical protein
MEKSPIIKFISSSVDIIQNNSYTISTPSTWYFNLDKLQPKANRKETFDHTLTLVSEYLLGGIHAHLSHLMFLLHLPRDNYCCVAIVTISPWREVPQLILGNALKVLNIMRISRPMALRPRCAINVRYSSKTSLEAGFGEYLHE